MPHAPAPDVTALLRACRAGDDGTPGRLVLLVHGELRRSAQARLQSQRPGHTLPTTALVNEACFRLVDARIVSRQNRVHLLAPCAPLVRQVLVGAARALGSLKRGDAGARIASEERSAAAPRRDQDRPALDEALAQFEAEDSRQSRVVELRQFGGVGIEEKAKALKVSPMAVKRVRKMAKPRLTGALRLIRVARPAEGA